MKTIWLLPALVVFTGTLMTASRAQCAPQIVSSSEAPALIVKNVQIDQRDGKIRGTVYLRFGYSAPLLPHVHVYGLNVSGRVIAEGCDKLSGALLSNPRPVGKGHSAFSANLGDLAGVTTIRVVASAGHSNDCKMEDNRIIKLF